MMRYKLKTDITFYYITWHLKTLFNVCFKYYIEIVTTQKYELMIITLNNNYPKEFYVSKSVSHTTNLKKQPKKQTKTLFFTLMF